LKRGDSVEIKNMMFLRKNIPKKIENVPSKIQNLSSLNRIF
jgi:hypothetical protein